MFERLEKPFLTVDTGEAYQPIRLTYDILQKETLTQILNDLKCCKYNPHAKTWDWFWHEECNDLQFDSIDSFKRNDKFPVRLAVISIRHDKMYINLSSFKRACLGVPFWHKTIAPTVAKVAVADFINKVFALDERLPHGLAELFNETELENIINQRVEDYQKIQHQAEQAKSAEEALDIVNKYSEDESGKALPFAERYSFTESQKQNPDPEVLFLGFYIFLRSRELVAIRRWFGEKDCTLSNVIDDSLKSVLGEINIDIS